MQLCKNGSVAISNRYDNNQMAANTRTHKSSAKRTHSDLGKAQPFGDDALTTTVKGLLRKWDDLTQSSTLSRTQPFRAFEHSPSYETQAATTHSEKPHPQFCFFGGVFKPPNLQTTPPPPQKKCDIIGSTRE